MKQLLKLAAICGLAAGLLGTAAASHAPKCPACHMELHKHWSKATPIAVRARKGGKTFYCCAGCVNNMPKWMIVHKHH